MSLSNKLQLLLLGISFTAPLFLRAQTVETTATHCHPDEVIRFSCQINRKTVSLCTGSAKGIITSLAYRYGAIGKIENEFIAQSSNKRRFYTTEAPANPDELIKQVWFDRRGIRYLLTECLGGGCEQSGRLAVLRGSQVLMNKPCNPTDGKRYDRFSRDFVSYRAEDGDGWSATELMIVELHDNSLDKLFPPPPGKTW